MDWLHSRYCEQKTQVLIATFHLGMALVLCVLAHSCSLCESICGFLAVKVKVCLTLILNRTEYYIVCLDLRYHFY